MATLVWTWISRVEFLEFLGLDITKVINCIRLNEILWKTDHPGFNSLISYAMLVRLGLLLFIVCF